MIPRFGLTHVILGHFASAESVAAKCAKQIIFTRNLALKASIARPLQYHREEMAYAQLDSIVRKAQLSLFPPKKAHSQSLRAQYKLHHVRQAHTRQPLSQQSVILVLPAQIVILTVCL